MDCGSTNCKCPCHKALGIFIALIGLFLLLGAFGVMTMDTVNKIWPALLILIGLKKASRGVCKCCPDA